ncbi:MAG: hypothetical protein JRI23_08185 [Deltaproteobacteria bacterium]|nr:hypothetical protein [Deltaproteobacteria bacterium]MBW2531591.1 hypothetical protein [Deltaproteobacteria bacterium]
MATLTTWPSTSDAQPDLATAARAFEQAQKAELAGEWSSAASFYELADSIAPSPEALRGALNARKEAGDTAKAATLALQLQRRHATHPPSRKLAQETLDEAAQKLVRLAVTCAPAPCTLQSDGQMLGTAALLQHDFFTDPGKRELVAFFGSRSTEPQRFVGAGGETKSLKFEEPKAEPAPAPATAPAGAATTPAATGGEGGDGVVQPSGSGDQPDRVDEGGGLHPAFAIIGGVATLGLGGVTIWSGVDTLDLHQHYEQNPTAAGYDEGESAQLRTNVLIGVTAGVGLATILVAAFATDWGGSDGDTAALPALDIGPDGAALRYGTSF